MNKDKKIRILEDALDSILTEASAGPAPAPVMTMPGDPIRRNPRDINSAAYAAEREAGRMDVLRRLKTVISSIRSRKPSTPAIEAHNSVLEYIHDYFNLEEI